MGNLQITILRGVSNNTGQKRNALDVSGVPYNCVFLAPNNESTAESGLFWTNFKKLKQKLKKGEAQRSVCLPSTDRWLYLCMSKAERLPEFHEVRLPRKCFRLAEGRNLVSGKYLATLTNF